MHTIELVAGFMMELCMAIETRAGRRMPPEQRGLFLALPVADLQGLEVLMLKRRATWVESDLALFEAIIRRTYERAGLIDRSGVVYH